MEKTLLEKFIEKYHTEEGSFSVTDGKDPNFLKYCHFLKDKVGQATYIYAVYEYSEQEFFLKLGLKPKIVAIEVAGIMYIVDEFFFDIRRRDSENKLPDNCKFFYECDANKYVQEDAFPAFYESLVVDDSVDTIPKDAMKYYIKNARRILFRNNGKPETQSIENIYNSNDNAKIICGFMDLEEETVKRLELKREKWTRIKTEEGVHIRIEL